MEPQEVLRLDSLSMFPGGVRKHLLENEMARTLTAADRSALIRLASTMEKGSPERKAILAGLEKTSAAVITDQQYDALRPGKRVYMDLSTGYGSTGGEREFVVGRTTYSKKYDVYSKTLYPVDAEGNPIKRGRAKYTLFKRKSGVSLGHGGMGTVIKSFRMG